MKRLLFLFIALSFFLFLAWIIFTGKIHFSFSKQKSSFEFNVPTSTSNLPLPSLSPTPTPTPKPLTFAEMNALYGPCIRMPVLMYHHIQDREVAKEKNQLALTVTPEYFRKHMQYLKERNYSVLGVNDLVSFFDFQTNLGAKNILITFDDAYEDFFQNAYPILREYGYKAMVFVPTGLINNPGYLNWGNILAMSSGGVSFANHTWSHKNVGTSEEILEREISTADLQLSEKGLNSPKVFAYPYGLENQKAEIYLQKLNYKAAFTTRSGSVLCTKQRYDLPRIRIGNVELSGLGL